ncbi:ATP-binding cassette domain-containing protein [Leptobacterium flavescens]|uniref:ATP-binding cassette domain-containing protein n=1 Tax=Leptobacterium flavescens TaxID=472055 RepID=A0A6P0UQH5_9FLAO|nr:ATP-binding cassette domain-containing protein [Leptobacterium flavescens]NER15207.1 ATP-binding cassette domain-containing protein [Leptobacterium flavescens]
MIEVKNTSKQYSLNRKQQKELRIKANTVAAVNNVSFSCKPGRVFSLLGPNGAGKTTLLRMIATILTPSSGNIEVSGFNTVSHSKEVRRKIGFLTGSTNLYDRLTPGEIVKYFADLYGMEKNEFNQRKEELFTRLGINDFLKKRIGQLSTGMKQKVSIARSMIHDPEVVIFDEPTSGLDVITANSIIQLIRDCKKEGKTVIFSSHIMSEVDLLCDDLAIISKGSLIYNNSMDAFREEASGQSLTATFIDIVADKKPQLI